MTARVPLARRIVFADPRRAALSTAGVAVALLLVLVLDGIFTGAMRQVTTYLRKSPADLIVSQRGVRTMHMSTSALPDGTASRALAVPGVAWAAPIRFARGVIASPTARQLSYVIGYTPDRPGGPQSLVAGRPPREGEAVVDRIAASQLGVRVGDRVRVLDGWLRISGVSSGGTSIVNTTTYVTSDDLGRLHGTADAYLLIAARPGVDARHLRDRLAAALPGTTVQTRSEMVASEKGIVASMSADAMRVITVLGLGIALAVVALSLLSLTLSRQRDYGILKALGARPARHTGVVAAEAAWTVALADITAVVLVLGVAAGIGRTAPTIAVWVDPREVARVTAAAAFVGGVAALITLRRVLAVDPASAFRKGPRPKPV